MPNRRRFPDDLISAAALLLVVFVLISAMKPPQAPTPEGWGKKVNGEIRYRASVAAGERR